MKDMKQIRKIIIVFFTILLVFSSCNNIVNEVETNNNTNMAYIKIDCNSARTIYPRYKKSFYFGDSAVSNWVLTGIKEGTTDEIIIYDSKYQLSGEIFPIEAGKWTFTLTAKEEETILSDTINKLLEQGSTTTLEFVLKVDMERTTAEYGILDVTFKMYQDTLIKGIKAGLYNVESEEPIDDFYSETLNLAVNYQDFFQEYNIYAVIAKYEKTTVPPGEYLLKTYFYSDEACTACLNIYESVVIIVAGNTSQEVIDVEVLGREHRIDYLLDGGEFVKGYEPPKIFSGFSSIQLPSSMNVKKDGYCFAGWFNSKNPDGILVTSVNNLNDDIMLYARWDEGIIITPEDVEYEDFLSTEFGDLEVFAVGNFSGNKFTKLCNVIKNYSGKIMLNMLGVTGVRTIPENAFKDCSSITRVLFPDTILGIGDSAFEGCKKLVEIDIPEGCTSIGNKAFYNGAVSDSVAISIPYTITNIGSQAFGNTNVRFINFIGNYEQWCKKTWNPTSISSAYTLYINGRATELIRSVELDGITSINDYAFAGCISLGWITIPDGVIQICRSAFEGCKNLEEITIPSSVKTIGYSAFAGCVSLRGPEIPEGVTSIEGRAFEGCRFSGISIPISVSNIGSNAFWNCSNLIDISLPLVSPTASILDNIFNALPDYVYSLEITVTGGEISDEAFAGWSKITKIILLEGVTKIGNEAFKNCSKITSVEIPASVVNIGESAFEGCYGLRTISIPESVVSIGESAFEGCYRLRTISIPESVHSIPSRAFYGCEYLASVVIPNTITTIGDYAFSGCSGLSDITIPNSVVTIGEYAFNNCKSITSITISNNGMTIGDYAFKDCSGLNSITLPDSFENISTEAFDRCYKINTINFNGSLEQWCFKQWSLENFYSNYDLYIGEQLLTNAIIPSSVTIIENYAFKGCKSITNMTIPNTVAEIGYGAFSSCKNLEEITIPFVGRNINAIGNSTNLKFFGYIFGNDKGSSQDYNSVTQASFRFTIPKKLEKVIVTGGKIQHDVFQNCNNLKSITIPNGVTTIGSSAFNSCSGLESIIIPNSVTTIESFAFEKCSGLKSINIPNSVTTIEDFAFRLCSGLESITFSNGIRSIGRYTFAECSGLESITIPDSVMYIGYAAFTECSSLETVTMPNSILGDSDLQSGVAAEVFSLCSNLNTIYFEGTLEQWIYKKWYVGWPVVYDLYIDGQLLTNIVFPNDISMIDEYFFQGCKSITDITIPSGVRMIEFSAFYNCTNLVSVVFEDADNWFMYDDNNEYIEKDVSDSSIAAELLITGKKFRKNP